MFLSKTLVVYTNTSNIHKVHLFRVLDDDILREGENGVTYSSIIGAVCYSHNVLILMATNVVHDKMSQEIVCCYYLKLYKHPSGVSLINKYECDTSNAFYEYFICEFHDAVICSGHSIR